MAYPFLWAKGELNVDLPSISYQFIKLFTTLKKSIKQFDKNVKTIKLVPSKLYIKITFFSKLCNSENTTFFHLYKPLERIK